MITWQWLQMGMPLLNLYSITLDLCKLGQVTFSVLIWE